MKYTKFFKKLKISMKNKILILLLIIVILICLNLYLNKRENFQATAQAIKSKEDISRMFNELEETEQKCEQLEEKQRMAKEIEEVRINESTFNELDSLDKKIEELTSIVKILSNKKNKHKIINDKCRENKQIKLNKNYDLLNKLNDAGLVNDESVNIDLNLSEQLKNLDLGSLDIGSNTGLGLGPGSSSKSSSGSSKVNTCKPKKNVGRDMINISKNKQIIEDKCHGCKVDKLVDR